jgi:hypothetical protein
MHPRGSLEPAPGAPDRLGFFRSIVQNPVLASDASFHEMTGEVGDVYLLHPLMVHSATKNATRVPRVITNPPVALKEPFRLSRGVEAGNKFSLVEQKTLRKRARISGGPGWVEDRG